MQTMITLTTVAVTFADVQLLTDAHRRAPARMRTVTRGAERTRSQIAIHQFRAYIAVTVNAKTNQQAQKRAAIAIRMVQYLIKIYIAGVSHGIAQPTFRLMLHQRRSGGKQPHPC